MRTETRRLLGRLLVGALLVAFALVWANLIDKQYGQANRFATAHALDAAGLNTALPTPETSAILGSGRAPNLPPARPGVSTADRIAADGVMVTYYTGIIQIEIFEYSLALGLAAAGIGLIVLVPFRR